MQLTSASRLDAARCTLSPCFRIRSGSPPALDKQACGNRAMSFKREFVVVDEDDTRLLTMLLTFRALPRISMFLADNNNNISNKTTNQHTSRVSSVTQQSSANLPSPVTSLVVARALVSCPREPPTFREGTGSGLDPSPSPSPSAQAAPRKNVNVFCEDQSGAFTVEGLRDKP